MRNKKIAIYFGMAVLSLSAAGCGSAGAGSDAAAVESVNFDAFAKQESGAADDRVQQSSDGTAANHQQSGGENRDTQQNNDEEQSIHPDSDAESVTELDGSVKNIGNNNVVINKVFHLSATTAVSYEGIDEQVLITVYFSDDTEMEVWRVRNGGVNGDADIVKGSGTFSDIKENSSIRMTGSYVGSDFYAKTVIIYEFL